MASKRSNNTGFSSLVLLLICLFAGSSGYAQIRKMVVADSVEVDSITYLPTHGFPYRLQTVGPEFAIDYSNTSTIRLGFSSAYGESSCVLMSVCGGKAVGITLNPVLNAYGVYASCWTTIAIINIGVRATYETNLTHQWTTIQPQVGLGIGFFRLTYNYNIPFFFDSRFAVPRHSLGIAYTFMWEKKESY